MYDALKKTKTAGPDGLKPYFLQIDAEFAAKPLTHIFNLAIESGPIPYGRQHMSLLY